MRQLLKIPLHRLCIRHCYDQSKLFHISLSPPYMHALNSNFKSLTPGKSLLSVDQELTHVIAAHLLLVGATLFKKV